MILHLDMDAFFAAVEIKRHSELQSRPVIVGGTGDPNTRGVVSTASYEARKYGIHSGMPLRKAAQLCLHAVFLPVDYQEYKRVSREIKKILLQFSPLLEDVGIDEAYLDISNIEQDLESITKRIKSEILDKTGLTCSIGIAPNKLLAKIASDLQKPDGLTIIQERDIEGRIWPLPIRKLWGIGPKTENRLKEMGIETIGQLAAISLAALTARFGQSYGNFLYHASKGIDERPVVTDWGPPKSLSRETTFENDIEDWPTISKVFAELSKDTVAIMKKRSLRCKTITLKLRLDDFATFSRSQTLDHFTDDLETIRKTVFQCFKRVELKRKIRLIGVRLSNFTE